MKTLLRLGCAFVLVLLIGCELLTNSPKLPIASQQDGAIPADPSVLEVPGRTQYVPGRKGIIAPVPLHPVVAVLVAPGDRVTKGQALIKLDDDEAQADVRAKRAGLEHSRIALQERRRHLGVLEKAYQSGAVSEEKYHEGRVATLTAEVDERVAKAALESAQAELEHFVVTAPIAGVLSWLDVHPGTVSRPGTTVWGEVLDLRAIDVHCQLTPEQADRVSVGQAVEVLPDGKQGTAGGRVVFVGITADKATGLVPVVAWLSNPNGHLRCNVPVRVRLHNPSSVGETK
jgi:RND family efflux transporter MFP subunit